jgi:hypothetical protein
MLAVLGIHTTREAKGETMTEPTRGRRPLEDLTMAKHCRYHEVSPGGIMERDGGHRCKLGVDILALVGGRRDGWGRRMPCYLPNKDEPGFVPCDKMEPHTTAELEAQRDALERGVQRILKQSALIEQVKRNRKGGTFECPACGGKLTISIASNGHTMGRCTGKDCSSWIE